jgi:hypothetical protein
MRLFKNSIIAAFGLALTLGTMGAASAAEHHPRRAEVVQRIHNQEHRINHQMREGKLAPKFAHKLTMKEHMMMRHEQRDARAHHGHITKGEQHALNRQLNHTNHRIGG